VTANTLSLSTIEDNDLSQKPENVALPRGSDQFEIISEALGLPLTHRHFSLVCGEDDDYAYAETAYVCEAMMHGQSKTKISEEEWERLREEMCNERKLNPETAEVHMEYGVRRHSDPGMDYSDKFYYARTPGERQHLDKL
jgi:hypothetical protein